MNHYTDNYNGCESEDILIQIKNCTDPEEKECLWEDYYDAIRAESDGNYSAMLGRVMSK